MPKIKSMWYIKGTRWFTQYSARMMEQLRSEARISHFGFEFSRWLSIKWQGVIAPPIQNYGAPPRLPMPPRIVGEVRFGSYGGALI